MRPLLRFAPALALLTACEGGDPFPTPPPTSTGTGPRIVWDLGNRPLPEIPIPNDIATWSDPNSPTGLRINASLVSPTGLESAFRAQFDELDGWGTYQAITIPFDADLDLGVIIRRHQRDDFGFPDDAIYLVDLGPNDPSIQPGDAAFGHPGLPMPIDIGEGNYQFTRRARDPLFANDPRAGESNIILETIDEDTNHDGILQSWEDTNFDGVLGRASIYPAGANAFDNLTGFYEASTHTLIIRPLLPLLENHRYAVVVTDRLVGTDGQPVRSPFAGITHPAQLDSLGRLENDLSSHAEIYGNLRWSRGANEMQGTSHVAFAWRYTTQTTVSEWFAVRDGLYGHGPFASLHEIEPRLTPANITTGSSTCSADQRSHPFVMRHTPEDPDHDPFQALFQLIWSLDDPGEVRRNAMLASYSNVAYLVAGTFHAPYLMNGDPRGDIDPQAHWQLNPHTGEVRHVGDAEIPFLLVVPKADAAHHAPFPLAYYMHGYGAGVTEMFSAAGVLAQNGIASIAIDGPTHGLPVTPNLVSTIRTTLRGACQLGLGDTLLRTNRARDLNGTGIVDPAGDFWCAYVPHSRDNVRQYALEISQLVRGIRGWDGHALAGVDLNANGDMNDDIAGDFDGDGMPDVGAGSNMYAIGESLGGIMSMMVGASEPQVRGAIPYSGGGGLSDVAIRSSQGGIKEAVYLRLMGPLVVGVPATDYGEEDYGSCTNRLGCEPYSECRVPAGGGAGRCHRTRTACAPGQISLRILSTDVTEVGELEFACANFNSPPSGDPHTISFPLQPGDDIVVQNLANHTLRCGRVGADGRFRVGIPSDTNDPLSIVVYEARIGIGGAGTVSAIEDFGTCEPSAQWLALQPRRDPGMSQTVQSREISEFHVVQGDCSRGCGHVPVEGLVPCETPNQTDCDVGFTPTYPIYRTRGDQLVTPAEGLGLRRQSPEFRRFLVLAQAALDKGDPISFAPYYFLRPSPTFEPPARHAAIVTNTIGDQNVPINTGNAFSRAAGIIPFLSADAPDHLREYRTPQALQMRYGRTPNRVLIDRWVLEGISFLDRWPIPNDPGALFDVDDLDEGLDGFGEQTENPPLRLVRLARAMSTTMGNDLDVVWAPTIGPMPWTAANDQPLAATMNYYVEPHGHHSVDNPPRPDLPWDYSTYAYNLAGRFFQSDGTDVYYRTHPMTHRCLETSTCSP
jgi:hypothetical protein